MSDPWDQNQDARSKGSCTREMAVFRHAAR